MQKNNLPRNIFIGIIVAAIVFGWWLRGFLYMNWHFKLFSSKSWAFIVNEFKSGWMLSSTSDWIFLLAFLAAIPLFLYLWYLSAKVQWRQLVKRIIDWIVRLFKKTTKTTKKKKATLAPPPPAPALTKSTKQNRPHVMAYQGNVVQKTEPDEYAPTFQENSQTSSSPIDTSMRLSSPKTMAPAAASMADIADMPLEEIQMPTRTAVQEDIPAIFQDAGYTLLKNIQMNGQKIEFLAVSHNQTYACIIDREPGDWLAEEEPFNGEAPLWFSEVDHRISPIYTLCANVKEMREKIAAFYPDMTLQGFMIEEKGVIINAEEMMRIWHELDVLVSRTDIGGTEDLPLTGSLLQKATPATAEEIEKLNQLFIGDTNG